MAEAVLDQGLIYELAAVVHPARKAQSLANAVQSSQPAGYTLELLRVQLRSNRWRCLSEPNWSHSFRVGISATCNAIHLHTFGSRLAPVCECAPRNSSPHLRGRAATLLRPCRATRHSQEPIDGRSTHGQVFWRRGCCRFRCPLRSNAGSRIGNHARRRFHRSDQRPPTLRSTLPGLPRHRAKAGPESAVS